MKMQELNIQEMEAVNGGLLGLGTSGSQSGLGLGTLNLSNLLGGALHIVNMFSSTADGTTTDNTTLDLNLGSLLNLLNLD